jgi:predicted nucleotidyltransferase component of viral defense system
VISKQELLQLRAEWQLDVGVIEKDYVLGWLLAAISAEPELSQTWIFKGGTCLRKCYYETYRFSEDLDFTVIDGGPTGAAQLTEIFRRVSAWLSQESGIDLIVEDGCFAERRNLRGNPTAQARIVYRGPNPQPTLPKIKLDITGDEALVETPVMREIVHPYGDAPLTTDGVLCYSITELAAEKTRALAERCRPRDLYDVIHMHRHPDLLGAAAWVRESLARKCEYVGIAVPDADAIRGSRFAGENGGCLRRLGHRAANRDDGRSARSRRITNLDRQRACGRRSQAASVSYTMRAQVFPQWFCIRIEHRRSTGGIRKADPAGLFTV